MTFDGEWKTRPRPVKEGLDALARRLGAPTVDALGAVFNRWEEAVGPGIAAHATPVSLRDGTLVVRADGPAWANQLRFLVPQLLETLAAVAGEGVVRSIEVRVGAG